MTTSIISPKLRHLSGLELPGGGQVVVVGNYAYVGHMKPLLGTSIIDVSDPANPRIVTQIEVGSPWSHTHKVRVVGDRMITNVEQDKRHFLRKSDGIAGATEKLAADLGRTPEEAEIAVAMNITSEQLAELRVYQQRGYDEGGFKPVSYTHLTLPTIYSV